MNSVLVSVRQVFDVWEHQHAEVERGPDKSDDHSQTPWNAALQPAVGPDDSADKPAGEAVRQFRFLRATSLPRLWLRLGRQDPRRGCGNHCDRNDQRNADRGADCKGDVAKQLPRLFFVEQHRKKDRQRGERRCQDRTPDFTGSTHRGYERTFALLVMTIDVFQHDHRIIYDHSHGERQSRQTDDIQRAPQQMQNQKGSDDARGDGQCNHQRRFRAPQKHQQHGEGQQPADDDVLLHNPDRRLDIVRFAPDLGQPQAALPENPFVQIRRDTPQLGHDVQHVGSGFHPNADADQFAAAPAIRLRRLFVTQPHFRDVFDVHGRAASFGDDRSADLLDTFELTERADKVVVLPLPNLSAGGILVSSAEGAPQVVDRQPASRQLHGIHQNLHFVFPSSEQKRIGDTRHTVEPRLDFVLDKTPHFRQIDPGHQFTQFGMLLGQRVESIQQKIPFVCIQQRSARFSQVRMVVDEFLDFFA